MGGEDHGRVTQGKDEVTEGSAQSAHFKFTSDPLKTGSCKKMFNAARCKDVGPGADSFFFFQRGR